MTPGTTPLQAWRFDELVREGLSLIPGYATAWTNHNASDPGITLVELLAFFTEVLVYRLGRVTPQAKVQFLRLLKGARWAGWEQLAEQDAEVIDHALQEAVRELGQRDCAVTAADFEQLAVACAQRELGPQVAVRALCIPGRHPTSDPQRGPGNMRAHVTVVLVPHGELDDAAIARLCVSVRERLLPHCLLTTRLHVMGPVVLHAGIGFRLALRPGARWDEVQAAIALNLKRRFGPWSEQDRPEQLPAPGLPLHVMDITQLIDATDGVDFVEDVAVTALSRESHDLHAARSSVGIQIGTRSTLGVDARLGVSHSLGTQRLLRDDAGRLRSVLLQPWEVLRLHLVPNAVRPLEPDMAPSPAGNTGSAVEGGDDGS